MTEICAINNYSTSRRPVVLAHTGPIGGVVMPVPDARTRTDDYWQECIRIRPTLVRIAARRCAAPVDPDDIVGEAMVRGAEFDDLDMSRLEQFLVSTVTRLCADEVRRRTVATRMAGHPRLVPPTEQDPAENACDRAEARWLAVQILALPRRDRELVDMVVDGKPHSEIARELGTTTQGAHSALYRLRKRIGVHRPIG
jgi:RNA polymerase sigma factor (sigma-70 family)